MSTLRPTVAVLISTRDHSCTSSDETLTLNFEISPSLYPISSPTLFFLTNLISPLTRILSELSGDHINIKVHRDARSEDLSKESQSKDNSPTSAQDTLCECKHRLVYESHLSSELLRLKELIRLQEIKIPYREELRITSLVTQAIRVKLVSMTGDRVVQLKGETLLLHDEFICALLRSAFSADDRLTLASLYMLHELVHELQGCSEKAIIHELKETNEMLIKDLDINADHAAVCIFSALHLEFNPSMLKDLQGRCLYLFPTTASHSEEARRRKVQRLISLRMDSVLCNLGEIQPDECVYFTLNHDRLHGTFYTRGSLQKHLLSITLDKHQYKQFSRALDPCSPEVFSERLFAVDAWVRDLLESSTSGRSSC